MSRNSAAPGHIHKTSCTGNKAIATLDRNTLDRIECSGRLECTVNFIAVGGYHHKLARTLIAVPGGGQETNSTLSLSDHVHVPRCSATPDPVSVLESVHSPVGTGLAWPWNTA